MDQMDADTRQRLLRLRSSPRLRPTQPTPVGPGQESVWDYPRPPRVEAEKRSVRVVFSGRTIAESMRARRVLETASPPTIYVPPEDVLDGCLSAAEGRSLCEWKGEARYWDVTVGTATARRAAWSYPTPFEEYARLAGWIAFFPGRVDCCTLGEERVRPQSGDYYGGWVTHEIVGPFKGATGTEGW